MSTKTLRKRIALVAVSALGVGLLSIVPAYANTATLTVTASDGTSTTSQGIVTAASGTSGTTITGSILNTGQLVVVSGAGTATSALLVSGGVITACVPGSGTVTLNAAGTNCSTSGTGTLTATIKGLTVGTNLVVSRETTNSSATWATDTAMTWSVVAAGSVNALDLGHSFFSTEVSATAATDNVDATWSPSGGGTAAATERNDGVAGYFGYGANDANGNALTGAVITASSTNGCLLNAGTDSAGVLTTAYSSTASSYFRVDQPTSHVAAKCVVTISVNGAVAASRTYNFRGQLAVIKVTANARVKAQSSATTAALYVDAQDAAGNSLDNITIAADTSYYNANLTTVSSATSAPWSTSTTASSANVTCGNSSDNNFRFKSTNASAVTIYSPVVVISCAGDPATYTATLDKTSYVPGDVATLTITAKDSKGALTNDAAVLGTTALSVAIAGSNMTAVSTPTNADTFTSGVKKYKFVVGQTGGSYQLAVDLPLYDSSTYSQSALTVGYSIANSGTQLNDVLAGIVKLIASINKQIAALQKALKK